MHAQKQRVPLMMVKARIRVWVHFFIHVEHLKSSGGGGVGGAAEAPLHDVRKVMIQVGVLFSLWQNFKK